MTENDFPLQSSDSDSCRLNNSLSDWFDDQSVVRSDEQSVVQSDGQFDGRNSDSADGAGADPSEQISGFAKIVPEKSCNLCGGDAVTVLSETDRRGRSLRTVICSKCGLVYTDPLPFDVMQYYSAEYRLDYKGAYIPKPKHVYRAGMTALDRFRKLGQGFLTSGASLLDIGSGGGEFVYLCRSLGLKAAGVEPNQGYAEYSKKELNLDIIIGRADQDLPQENLDAVTIWHVLEHIDDPLAVLAKLKKIIKPKGHLVIEVPNIEAVCQAPGSTFHAAHIFSFSPKTLEALAFKAGYEKVSLSVSSDGGNILLVCRPREDGGNILEPDWADLAVCGFRTAERIRQRTRFSYLVTGPWLRRMAARQMRALSEWFWLTFRAKTNKNCLRKSILDALYEPTLARERLIVAKRLQAAD
ncbi:MAG: class I SAM-dependent methyltransferase [Deltaproteobacteria bacterium]|nr:class I SAM-dependent methyltransferase [Deltaproteobacteria bacterium]